MSKRNKKNRAIRDLGAESLGQDSADENSDTQNSYYQYLEHFIDEIYEKKAAARERGIEKLVEELQTHYSYDFVNQRRTVLLEIITRILKRGSSNEKTLACRLATVLTITLGVDALEVFQLLAPILQEHIRTLHESSVTSVYVDTLAMISFIACESESEIREIIELFGSVLTTDRQQLHADVIQSALNAWGLLLTVVDSKYLTQQLIPTYLKCIVNYLNDAELAVQISAGEDIALVTSLLNTLNSRDGNPEDANIESDNFSNDDNESQSTYKPPHQLANEIDVNKLIERLHEIKSDRRRHHLTSKEKKIQRQDFKEIVKTVECGSEPKETLVFKHQRFNFESWPTQRRLDYFRSTLAQGLAVHMEQNELLADIFDLSFNKEPQKVFLTPVQKRQLMSPNSFANKERALTMRSVRGMKQTQALWD